MAKRDFIDRMFELPESQIACISAHYNRNDEAILSIPIASLDFQKAAETYGYTLGLSSENGGMYCRLYIIAPSIRRSDFVPNKYHNTD